MLFIPRAAMLAVALMVSSPLFAAGLQFHEPLRHMRRSGRGMQWLPGLLHAAQLHEQQSMLCPRRRDLLDGGRVLQLRWQLAMQRPGQVLRAPRRTLHWRRGVLLGHLQRHAVRGHARR